MVKGKILICFAATLLSACDQQSKQDSAEPPTEPLATSSAAEAAVMPETGQLSSSALQSPDVEARQAALDKSIRGIWRKTPYQIEAINYLNENSRPVGENGAQYDATVSVTLKFASSWNAECIGPGAAYGCQFLDANMMQMKPIPSGDSRTYTGTLSMAKMDQPGSDWESRVRWEQRVE